MIEVKFTCADAHEFKNLLTLLTQGNEEAASAYEAAPAPTTIRVDPQAFAEKAADPEQPTTDEIAAVEPAEQEPEQEPQEEPTPAISLQDLQSIGRKLAAAGKGNEVQAVLKAHGVKLLSKIPENERHAVYTELQQVALDMYTDLQQAAKDKEVQ